MTATQIIEAISTWGTNNLPIAIGIGVTALVFIVLFLPRRKTLDLSKLASTNAPNPILAEKAANWAPPEQSYADRRGAVRREGPPVRVHIASPTFRRGITDGYVLDRSTGGLRIAIETAVAPGTLLQVRAANAPDTVGFVTLIVRSCRKSHEFYELGCEFEQTPPWNVLLLFG
jgi:hypothetical protein